MGPTLFRLFPYLCVAALFFSGCGTQIKALRGAALVSALATPPTFLPGQFVVNGGVTPTLTNYVPVAFVATGSTSPITHYCLKYNLPATPAPGDACWVPVSPTNYLAANVNFRIGFSGGAYTVYGWAKNAAGLVSDLTNSGTGTAARDTAAINFTPIPAPALSGVTASSADGVVNLAIPSGNSVFVKWTATTTGIFAPNPISIYYTTDDVNYTLVSAALPNAQGAGCTLSGAETGCYKWTASSPTNGYYRIRVGALDLNSRQSFQSSLPLNVGTSLRVLAGATDPGTGGSAESAIFMTPNLSQGVTDPQSFVVTTAGILYFNDTNRGILKVDPSDGVQQLIIRKTGVAAVDGAVPGTATLRSVISIALDSQGRVLLFDYDRIRRYDPAGNTVTTIIGGGGSTAPSVAPLSLQINPFYGTQNGVLLFATPAGKIYFQADHYGFGLVSGGFNDLRVYDPGTNLVTTIDYSGTGDSFNPAQDITTCNSRRVGATYDPVGGALTKIVVLLYHSGGGCPGSAYANAVLDGSTYMPSGPHPLPNGGDYAAGATIGNDGQLYTFNRISNTVQKFDQATQTTSTVLGTGTNGTCADGTLATACNIDVSDAYADANGKLYYFERGKVRTVDQANRVYTVAGSGMSTGDGSAATSARIGAIEDLKLWNDGTSDRVVFADNSEFRFREFVIGGTIQTVAGNGSNQDPDTVATVISQGIRYNGSGMIDRLTIQVDAALGTIYSGNGPNGYYSKIDRSTGKWVTIVGGGGTNYYDPTADGKLGNQISLPGYPPTSFGFDGTNVLLHQVRYDPGGFYTDAFLKTYSVVDGTQSALAGVPGASTFSFSADGTLGTSSTVSDHPAYGMMSGVWDAFASRWVFNNGNTAFSAIRTLSAGGAIGTLVTLPSTPTSFTYRHDGANDVVYYCTSGVLNKYNVTAATNTALAWPIAKMRCSGRGMVYSTSRSSLIFPYTQDGIGGVAEYLNP